MSSADASNPLADGHRRAATGWAAVAALAVGATALRLAYVLWLCPYSLVEDEAHYWEWSRRLEWSYYSKGPGVAWAIAASTRLFKELGVGLTEGAVRAPAPLFGGLLVLAVAALAGAAAEPERKARARIYGAAAALLAPAFWFGSLLMTIDVPYAACWGIAAGCLLLALRRGSGWAWAGAGLALAIGFLFKYTILLLLPGVLAFAFVSRRELRLSRNWGRWAALGAGLFVLGLLPVAIWNGEHDWATVRHLLGHLRVEGGDTKIWPADRGWHYNPLWTLELIGTQLALAGPALLVALWAAGRAWRTRSSVEWPERLFLLLCAAPIFVFYLAVSFVAEPQGNWPLAGHVTLLALAGWGAAVAVEEWKAQMAAWRALPAPRPWKGWLTRHPETFPRLAWRTAVIVGIVVAVLSLRADWVAASPPIRVLGWAAHKMGAVPPGRPLVPLGRLIGARIMAEDADRLVREVRAQTGREPFVVAQQYGRASLLAFYMPGRPTVYCSSSKSEGRRTQYDLWKETDLDDPALTGRPAILVGGKMKDWTPAFEQVREYGQLEGETKKDRLTFIGEGYRGWPAETGRAADAAEGTP
jgi:hypothetical protein